MELLSSGIIRRSSSGWATPLHLQSKANGGWRPCGDYRFLNKKTVLDRYPIKYLRSFTGQLHGKGIFSKIDLTKGYHQIPIAEEDRHKTAVITPWGLFEFNRLPMGLANSAQAFQRLMDEVTSGLDFCYVYLDDIEQATWRNWLNVGQKKKESQQKVVRC